MARILIVGGGCRGRALAERMVEQGHAVRITTRREDARPTIEATGAECWIGTPDRLETLRGSLDGVTIACWLLAQAHGEPEQIAALHSSRLELFLSQAIDTTVRGLIYDATPGPVSEGVLAEGARTFVAMTELNAIPAALLRCEDEDGRDGSLETEWVERAGDAVRSLLGL